MIPKQKFAFKRNQKTKILFTPQFQGMCKKTPPYDMIGPANPISNLRPIIYAVQENETPTEKLLRQKREELQIWNENFWTKNNLNFLNQKKEFIMNRLCKKHSDVDTLDPDEISVFYNTFLRENRALHISYLFEWYKRNIITTYLHFKVNIEKMFRKR